MIEATYIYTDDLGKPVAMKQRTTNKRFRMKAARFKNDRLYWKGEKGCLARYQPDWADRLLFNLPVVLDALRYGKPVFLVEGERDCLAVNTLFRLPATTGHLGAKQFTTGQARWFVNSRSPVHIVRDADHAGAFGAWVRYQRLIDVGVGPERIHLWRPRRPAKDVCVALARWGATRTALRRDDLAAVTAIANTLAAQRAARAYLSGRSA